MTRFQKAVARDTIPTPGVSKEAAQRLHDDAGSSVLTMVRRLDRWSALIFFASLALYLLVSVWLTKRLSLTGDEPWYLLLGYALIHTHSINLAPLFHDPRVYAQFLPGGNDGTHAADFRGNGELVMYYMPGYALLSGIVYLVGRRIGILAVQAVLAAALCVLVYTYTSRLFRSRAAGLFAWLAFLWALPALLFVGQIYPSTFATLLAFGSFVILTRFTELGSERRVVWVSALLAIVSAALPWLHLKYALLALVIAGLTVLQLRLWQSRQSASVGVRTPQPTQGTRGSRRIFWLASGLVAGLPLLSFALMALYSHRAVGSWIPKNSVTPGANASFANFDLLRMLAIYADMFLSGQSGLLVWVPLYFLAIPGFVLLVRRNRRQAGFLLALVVGMLGEFATSIVTPSETQGFAMPARFAVECAPFLAVCATAVFAAGWASVRPLVLPPASRTTGARPRMRAGALIVGISLLLLVISGWFTFNGLRTPEILYSNPAGNRIAQKYTTTMPGWWFASFPDFTHIVMYTGQVALAEDRTPSSGALPNTIGWSNTTALASIPPGRYIATYTLTCAGSFPSTSQTQPASGSVTVRAERIAGARHTLAGEQEVPLPNCATGQTTQITLPFTSVGYEPTDFELTQPPTVTLSSIQVSYRPA